MSYWTVGLTIVIIVVVIAVVYYVTVKGLFHVEPPWPEGSKARFIRALTCAYAMCVKDNCNDPDIIDIGFLGEGNTRSCWKVCDEFEKLGHTGHKCGRDFKIEFEFLDDVTYFSNYWDGGSCDAFEIRGSIQSDLKRASPNWQTIQDESRCFKTVSAAERINIIATSTKLDGPRQVTPWKSGGPKFEISLDPGCIYVHDPLYGLKIRGMCEGMLRHYKNCEKGDTQGTNQLYVGTGHLWIDSAIIDQCEDFDATETTKVFGSPTNTRYYASCNFNSGQKIYIWTEPDIHHDPGLFGWGAYTIYCPELVICSS